MLDLEKDVIRQSSLTKAQFYEERRIFPIYAHTHENHESFQHFLRSIRDHVSFAERKSFYYSKKKEMQLMGTSVFAGHEKRYSDLILETLKLRPEFSGDFVNSILSSKTTEKRKNNFYTKDEEFTNLLSPDDFLILEKEFEEIIVSNYELPSHEIVELIELIGFRKIALIVTEDTLEEDYVYHKKWAKEILGRGRGSVKSALGEKEEPWWFTLLYYSFVPIVALMIFKCSLDIEVYNDPACEKLGLESNWNYTKCR